MKTKRLKLALAALAACGLAGCSGGGSSSGPTPPSPPPSGVASLMISPRGLTLPVGGIGQLSAEARDSRGAIMSGVTVAWTTIFAPVASVVSNGMVRGNAKGETRAVATAGSTADTVPVVVTDNFTLEVTPPLASVNVGQTVAFAVTARDGSGNAMAAPPVSWSSSSPAIATIASTGVATGVSPGLTNVVASAGMVRSPSALLTVSDPSAAGSCYGITSVRQFKGTVDYGYKVVGARVDGGFAIDADDGGNLSATLTQISSGPFIASWAGDIGGNASVTQRQVDPTTPDQVSTYTGGGAITPIPQVGLPKMQLHVNLQTCTYHVYASATIPTILTTPYSRMSQVDIVAVIQFTGHVNSNWRTVPLFRPTDTMGAHTVAWAGLNPDVDALMPLGFAKDLFDRSGLQPGVASGGYLLTKLP